MSGTVTLIIDAASVIMADSGMIASRAVLLAALAARGQDPADVIIPGHGAPFRPSALA